MRSHQNLCGSSFLAAGRAPAAAAAPAVTCGALAGAFGAFAAVAKRRGWAVRVTGAGGRVAGRTMGATGAGVNGGPVGPVGCAGGAGGVG